MVVCVGKYGDKRGLMDCWIEGEGVRVDGDQYVCATTSGCFTLII